MKCPRCQHENASALKFCGECGARLAAVCVSCGAANSPEQKFCGQCGTRLSPGSAEARLPSPDSYTPKHLAERILTSKSALEGERKQVTVLFADLKSSMELLADRDPEEARKILDPVLERMMEAVHRYEGTVNQVMGDGIMALFGAPIAHEDHAVRACYAALRMQQSVQRYAEDMRRKEGLLVQIRVGLNSGEVVVRAIGSDLHMDYTAVGQTTHLAARMEQLAAPGTALMSADTLHLAEGYVQVKPLGPVSVKGLADSVEVYELTGAGTARTRLQAAAQRGLTRFVGRDAEIEHLRRVLGQANAGRGQVVAIVGEAGVGKSRLTYEFTHSHRVQEWLVLEAPSVSYGKATSYLPVIDLLKGYFKISDRDDHREMRDKVLGRVLGLDRALEVLLPPLLALLDVPVEDTGWMSLDPLQRRQRTLDALKRTLLREAQVQPLLVVFEDLHWVDGETQALLDSLVESLGSARLVLLVNYRPEYEHRWGSKTAYSQLRLDSLPAESAAELLRALLGPDPGLAPLTQTLVKRGNPFFLEETVRTLVETGALAGERGAYRLTRPVETLQVPPTVQTILAARIDRLAAEDKQLLQTAAVIGKDVPHVLLAAIAELREPDLEKRLAVLQAAEFIYQTNLFPDLEYTFKHALTHEVAYSSMLHEKRKELHARIVEAMETLYEDRLAEQVERLAQHALRGELWGKGVAYLGRAGDKAIHRSAYREGIAATEQALTALQHLPPTREMLELGIDLRLKIRTPLTALGEHERMLNHAREAEKLAKELGDSLREGWSAAWVCVLVSTVEGPEEGVEYGERAVSIALEMRNGPLECTANFALGAALLWLGQYRKALPRFHRSANVARLESSVWQPGLSGGLQTLASQHIQTAAHAYAAWCLAELGDFQDALMQGEEARRIAEAADFPYARGVAYEFLGFAHLRQGNLVSAIPLLEQCLDLSRKTDSPVLVVQLAMRLGYAYVLAGRVAEAIVVLEEGRDLGDSSRNMVWVTLIHAHLADAYALAGRHDEAATAGQRAVELTQQYNERSYAAWAQYLMGNVYGLVRPDPDARSARAAYLAALQIATELEMRPLIAQCHLALGSLSVDSPDERRSQLATGTAMFREMNMLFWLEKAESALAGF